MRKSFGSSGKGGMGGGGGGGGIFRSVGKAVGGGVGGIQETFPTVTRRPIKKPTNHFSLKSKSSSSSSSSSTSVTSYVPDVTISATWHSTSSSSCFCDSDEWEWECVDGGGDEGTNGFYDRFVFGPVPSKDEVEDGVSTLQLVLAAPVSFPGLVEDVLSSSSDKDLPSQVTCPMGLTNEVLSAGSELDWIEPALHIYEPKRSNSHGRERFYDAFQLLQTDPSVQRMVVSLSTDKAVWDAVLNNEVVQELRDSYTAANDKIGDSEESFVVAKGILRCILDNTTAKMKDLFDKITKLVNEMLRPSNREIKIATTTNMFENNLRYSLMLSVVVILIVVVTRANRV